MSRTERYAGYAALKIVPHDDSILEIVMGAGRSANRKLSTADHDMHRELAAVWRRGAASARRASIRAARSEPALAVDAQISTMSYCSCAYIVST